MRYAFFPGCSLESTAWDFGTSTRAVCRALEIELLEIPDWVCCGSTPAHATSPSLSTALPALNLEKARELGAPVMAACASCYARLRTANHKLRADAAEREAVASLTGTSYAGEVVVRHLLDVLVNDLKVEGLRPRVVRPFDGLKVACYYGCLLSRPPEVVAFDDPEHPTSMDNLLEAAGCQPVDWPYKTECCGASLSLTNTSIVARLAQRLLATAHVAGAECIAVACPLCQVNLDLRQADARRAHGGFPPLPVLYITQLLGLALGLEPDALGLTALFVSAAGLVGRRSKPAGAAHAGAIA